MKTARVVLLVVLLPPERAPLRPRPLLPPRPPLPTVRPPVSDAVAPVMVLMVDPDVVVLLLIL